MINITRQPTEIGDALDGRKAAYYGGTATARWYWRLKRGDKTAIAHLIPRKLLSRLIGLATDGSRLIGIVGYANGFCGEIFI